MCGIAGYLGYAPPDESRVEASLAAMRSRGPDGRGVFRQELASGRTVILAHTRLSIIDLNERANQPMAYRDAQIAFNGELYNFIELREDLKTKGFRFRTTSDTEVLLVLLRERGIEALDAAEGMWAFAYFDPDTDSLTLCRDRFGEKPVFYHQSDDGVYFASEIGALFALMGRRLPVNWNHIARFLVGGYGTLFQNGQHFFDGVKDLAPGTWMRVSAEGSVNVTRYWSLRYQPEQMSFDEAAAAVRERLIQSVLLRLRSDVPVACFLSGGVDSTSVASIVRRVANQDIACFSVMNDDPRYDERAIIAKTVTELDVRHHKLFLRHNDTLDTLQQMVARYHAPVATATTMANWQLSELLSQNGFRAVLMGTGGDEGFTGYYEHYPLYLAAIKGTSAYDDALRDFQTHVQPAIRNPYLSNPDTFVNQPDCREHVILGAADRMNLLCRDYRFEFEEHVYSDDLLRNRMMNLLFHEGVRINLHEIDLNTMAFAVEARAPILDRPLFELAYRIPSPLLIRDGYAKAILREAMRGIAPDHVRLSREKHSLNVPFEKIIDVNAPNQRKMLMADNPIFDLLDRDRVKAMIDSENTDNSHSKFLFSYLSCRLFLEKFV